MKKIMLFLFTVILLFTPSLPLSAESLGTEELEELLDYVPYSAHENLTIENTEENLKTDPFAWAFIQECIEEFGIDTSNRRYNELWDYVPGAGYEMEIPEGEIFYEEEQLQDIMMKMYNTTELTFDVGSRLENKTIYVPYEVGGFLFDFESGKYIYSNLGYLGGDFGNLTPHEYSKAVDCQISDEELYVYEKYAVFYKTADLYFIYGVLDHDTFYADGDHSNMYEIASGEALSRYTLDRDVHLDPIYQKLFSGEMDDELALYKHTYKKNENGDWYWSSSELVSVGAEQIPDTSDNGYLYPILAICSLIITFGAFTVQKRTKE